ncbi:MAG: hypothetical protein WCI74_07690 [Actinomycetes bacterium]
MSPAPSLVRIHGEQGRISDQWKGTDGLPLVAELRGLLPHGTLRRGTSVGISGQVGHTSLLLTLLAGPVENGSWAAIVGMPALGPEAANEFGISLDRLALIPDPGEAWLEVTAALLDSIDIVALHPVDGCRPNDARRLLARARERHSVLILIDDQSSTRGSRRSALTRWPQPPDLVLEVTDSDWYGLGDGHGNLHECALSVTAGGRRLAGAHRTVNLTTGHTITDPELPQQLLSVAR